MVMVVRGTSLKTGPPGPVAAREMMPETFCPSMIFPKTV